MTSCSVKQAKISNVTNYIEVVDNGITETYETILVKVISEELYYVGDFKTTKSELEKTLLNYYKTTYKKHISISANTNVKVRGIVFVMTIANKYKIKSTLVKSNQ